MMGVGSGVCKSSVPLLSPLPALFGEEGRALPSCGRRSVRQGLTALLVNLARLSAR